MLKGKKFYGIIIIAAIVLYVIALEHADRILTYLEYTTVNEKK